jgi:hypothetical protein
MAIAIWMFPRFTASEQDSYALLILLRSSTLGGARAKEYYKYLAISFYCTECITLVLEEENVEFIQIWVRVVHCNTAFNPAMYRIGLALEGLSLPGETLNTVHSLMHSGYYMHHIQDSAFCPHTSAS